MNSNNIWSISFLFIAAMYFSNAYGIKKNDQKRQQALGRVKVNKNKSVQTSRRTFKSIEGYLDFTFYDYIFAGALCTVIAIPSYILESPVFDLAGTVAGIFIYIGFNLFLFKKLKDK